MDSADRPTDFVGALAKGLAILESFDALHPDMNLSDVARRVGISPAAARRSLITLTELGYTGQHNKRFFLRPKVMTLGSAFYFSARIDELLQPDLRELVGEYGDASSVGTLNEQDVIYVAHVSEQRSRRAVAAVGARYPAFATSMGRVLLAALQEDQLEAYFAELDLEPLTSKTCVDISELRSILTEVRRDGYATTVDQLDYGITALAVPIRDQQGRTIAALNTSGYTGIVSPDLLINERLPDLQRAASHIAHEIARYPILQSMLGL